MKISITQVPQADELSKVILAVDCLLYTSDAADEL